MARVKGTMLIDCVKTIRADKRGQFDQFLTVGDRKIISERILPSAWYPYQTYRNCLSAVSTVAGNNNAQTLRQWGWRYSEALISGIYRGIIKDGEPIQSLEKYSIHVHNLFDFGEMQAVPFSSQEAEMVMRGFDPDFQPQYHLMRGWLERSVEMCGASDVRSDFSMRSWEGAPETRISLFWQMARERKIMHRDYRAHEEELPI